MVSAGVGEDLEVEAFCISTIGGDTDEHRAHQVAHHSSRHAWRHHLVVPPPISVEDIARPTPLRKGTRPSSDSSHLVKNRSSFNSASDALPSTPAGTGGFMI